MTAFEDLGSLSERELEVLRLVATGATNQQIARGLTISPNTVKVHLRNIFEKLGVQSRTEATMEAVRRGWVMVPGEVFAFLPPVPQEDAKPDLPPISLPELMPHAPVRRPVARWQHVTLLLALFLALLGAVAPSWWRGRIRAASPNAFSDQGRLQTTAPARITAQRWSPGAPLPEPRAGWRWPAMGGVFMPSEVRPPAV